MSFCEMMGAIQAICGVCFVFKFPKLFLKIGFIYSTIVLVLLSIGMSLAISLTIVKFLGGPVTFRTVLVATVTPGVIAGFFCILILRLVYDLDKAEQKYRELSITDDLTGIHNRRAFMEIAERELAIARRYGVEFSLVVFDIDDLKKINDKYGHLMGDKILQEVAHVCSLEIRQSDVLARIGGDEFVILVTQSENLNIEKYLDRLRQTIRQIQIDGISCPNEISASMGAAKFTKEIETIDELYRLADQEMYKNKAHNNDH